MQERLGGEDLTDRRCERRPSGLRAHPADLLEHVQQPVRGGVRAEVHLERRDEPGRKVVLRRPHRDARWDRRHRLVADVLVDDVRGFPQLLRLNTGRVLEPLEGFRERFTGDPVERQREWVHRSGDEVGSGLDGRERGGDAHPGRALDVEADREPARLPNLCNQLTRLVRKEGAGRVVDDDPCRAELRQLARLFDERCGLVRSPGAVDEPGVKRASRARDRRAGLAQVRDVVQRVVQAEDLDPVLGRTGHEPPHDVAADRPRSDEEATAERDPQRSRHARLDRPDPLPRALDAPSDGRVEHASAGDLEAGEARGVEDLGHAEDLRGRNPPRQRLLREQPDRRVDQLRHRPWTLSTGS